MSQQPHLTLHFDPRDQTLRLEGWARIRHPQRGRGGHFAIAFRLESVQDKMGTFAADLANDPSARFLEIPVLGTVWWGAKWGWNASEIVMVDMSKQGDQLSLSVTVTDPRYNEFGDEEDEGDDTDVTLFSISRITPSLLADSLAYRNHGHMDMADIGKRVMAGLRPGEPTASDDALAMLAALRIVDAAVPSQSVAGRFALPLI